MNLGYLITGPWGKKKEYEKNGAVSPWGLRKRFSEGRNVLCNLADGKQEFFTKEEAVRQNLEIATEFPEEFTEQYTRFDPEVDGSFFSRIKARWNRMYPHSLSDENKEYIDGLYPFTRDDAVKIIETGACFVCENEETGQPALYTYAETQNKNLKVIRRIPKKETELLAEFFHIEN